MFGGNKKDGGDKGGGLNKLGAFWQKVVTKAKGVAADTTTSVSEQLASLSIVERNHMAAQMASSQLGLDAAEREQVAKAIEAEMKRRHEERERRRKQLVASTQAQLPWGKKPAAAVPAASGKSLTVPAKEPKKVAPKPSVGASVYPIKFEMVKDTKGVKKVQAKSAVDLDPWDESSWKPVSVVTPLEKSSQQDVTKKAVAPKSVTGVASPSSSSSEGEKAAEFGSQPAAIQMDEEAVREIHAHTLGMMLQSILVQASDAQGKQKGKAAAQEPKSARLPAAKPSKKPGDMTVDELVELLKTDPAAWDQYTTQNTVISFGVVTPTGEDEERAQKTKEAKKERKISFDDEIDVAKAPVGKDFQFNERLDRSTGALKK